MRATDLLDEFEKRCRAQLVLDSISFVDTTWFGRGGYFHSSKLHIVEKLTRTGNEILYEIIVEDPEALVGAVGDGAANAAAQPES